MSLCCCSADILRQCESQGLTMIRFTVAVRPWLAFVLVLKILGLYTLNELKRTNWDAFGNYQAKQGKEYIERYVSCGCFVTVVLLGNWNLIDAERGVLVKATTLIPLLSMRLLPGRLKGCLLVLKLRRKTWTRYYPLLSFDNKVNLRLLRFADYWSKWYTF